MFLAVPVIAIIKILIEDFVDYRLAVKKGEKVIEEAKLNKE